MKNVPFCEIRTIYYFRTTQSACSWRQCSNVCLFLCAFPISKKNLWVEFSATLGKITECTVHQKDSTTLLDLTSIQCWNLSLSLWHLSENVPTMSFWGNLNLSLCITVFQKKRNRKRKCKFERYNSLCYVRGEWRKNNEGILNRSRVKRLLLSPLRLSKCFKVRTTKKAHIAYLKPLLSPLLLLKRHSPDAPLWPRLQSII